MKNKWCEHNKNITGTYTPCLICCNAIGDSNEATDKEQVETLTPPGALTPLGEKLAEIKKKIIEKSTFEPGTSSNGWYQIYKDDLDSIL